MEGWGGGRFRTVLDQSVAPYLWRPWYDRVATPAIARLFFPLSRAWAAAVAAQGDPDVFHATVDTGPPRRLVGVKLLGAVDRAWREYTEALDDWEAAFFGGEGPSEALNGLDRRRLTLARKAMALRAGFLPAHLERSFPAIRFEIENAVTVEARHGVRLAAPDGLMSPPDAPDIRQSRPFLRDGVVWRWGRFATPDGAASPPAEARIREPAGRVPRGTMIFAHGIGMETEMWGEEGTIPDWFLAQGFRVIEPQGPWHARRRLDGWYGGEPIFAHGPGGLLDYSWLHVREIGTWIAHARELDAERDVVSPGPVLLSGISLGALTVMQLLSWARRWRAEARPDFALLIAPAASLTEVAYRGSLTGSMGVPQALAQAGWTEETVGRWSPLLDAADSPAINPDRIGIVLGDVDEITPYASGEDLVRQWAVPAENVWTRNQGHFTVSLGLTSAPEPLHRMLELVAT
ncbi:hypothetical protein HH303_03000 [Rhodospirillaceae bacterium KN72]|uniref:Alpha/beta hydrolase n=1 Tax=Pacificispira spongiicola TaxID=2729598 RepID=A0A7Y0HD51_9PROT|nr:hypothetical protein [Pacificispira spongiicola]NMM43431.1 hypothetical protein [Pacificispira spongiicola]